MAVRAPTWLSDALRWRWTPAVALVFGSLLYVVCAMVLVPSDIDFSARGAAASVEARSALGNSPVSTEGVDSPDAETADEGAPATRRQKRQRRRAAAETAETAPEAVEEPAAAPQER